MTLTMLGAKPVFLHTSAKEGFLPSPERCAALITPKTKAIVLVTPNNPVSLTNTATALFFLLMSCPRRAPYIPLV